LTYSWRWPDPAAGARLLSPYREHLAKHFADTFSRIGLPEPYDTKF
jgi:hypothetical protein